jgi:hypothetical protein
MMYVELFINYKASQELQKQELPNKEGPGSSLLYILSNSIYMISQQTHYSDVSLIVYILISYSSYMF